MGVVEIALAANGTPAMDKKYALSRIRGGLCWQAFQLTQIMCLAFNTASVTVLG
jgi:hypothetical protein